MPIETGHETEVQPHPHHPNKHRAERFEGAADLLVVGIIIALAAAMLIGLLTTHGSAPWMN